MRSYVMARFSRIYPLHLFTLLLVVGLWVTMSFAVPVLKGTTLFSVLDPSALLQNIALLHAMGTTTFLSWNVPSWSIAAEWWTYLVAVLLFPFLNVGKGWRNWLSIASCLAGLVALEQIHPGGALDITWDLGVVRCLLSFTIGVGLYQLYRSGWGASILRRDASFVAAALLTLVLLHRTPSDVLLIPVFSILLLSTALNSGRIGKLLSRRPMRYLGDISYSIYMMQGFWLFLFWAGFILYTNKLDGFGNFGFPLPFQLLSLLSLLALVTASAGLTYRFVEIPARDWIRRRTTRPVPTEAVVTIRS